MREFATRPGLARHAVHIRLGKGRARFWRALGFPNCALARAAKAKLRAERLAAIEEERRKAELEAAIEQLHRR